MRSMPPSAPRCPSWCAWPDGAGRSRKGSKRANSSWASTTMRCAVGPDSTGTSHWPYSPTPIWLCCAGRRSTSTSKKVPPLRAPRCRRSRPGGAATPDRARDPAPAACPGLAPPASTGRSPRLVLLATTTPSLCQGLSLPPCNSRASATVVLEPIPVGQWPAK
ncbi:hypothetical protein p2A362 (plasmid) [Aromatoleum aromaticum EbN1]|uniref:Uncharacterized protein n=1 Tax=Aromatoleum aromaticum (strain DSM 19018 / LMG 30748 / EbN1) TaxID=76114 RepID=Q5NW63_AROAE|nr:hypothetical protein p2A362 [Aromatoleum aromaticum EbN1]